MTWAEEDYVQLSGIQHFSFCRRQWALIAIEQAWEENVLTMEGARMHERAHNEALDESRGDLVTLRGLRISSPRLGASGACDVVELRRDEENGVLIPRRDGRWLPCPVEYKHGREKADDMDVLQLCAQAMCLEEMFVCPIERGALYYGETRRRVQVSFSAELREKVEKTILEMHEYLRRGAIPQVKRQPKCKGCSLKDLCMPELSSRSAGAYIDGCLREDSP